MRRAAALAILAALALGGCISTNDQRKVDSSAAASANVQLGVALMNQGKMEEAKAKLERAEKQDPKNPEVKFALAEFYSRLSRVEVADQHYREAMQLAPDKLEIVNGYAAFLCTHGEVDKALAQFTKLMNNPLYGRQAAAATNAGMCLRDQKRHGDAVRFFETALAKQPDWIEAVVQLADTQISLGKPEAARKAVDNYQSMLNSATVLVLGVRASVAQGDCTAAQAYARKLRSDFGNSRETLVMLPQVLGNCSRAASL